MVCGMCASVTCIKYKAQGIHMLDLPCRPHRLKTVIIIWFIHVLILSHSIFRCSWLKEIVTLQYLPHSLY